MRKWIIFAIALSIVAVAAIVALRSLDAALNAKRDWLAGEAEARLGRGVSFDHIGVSPGVALAVQVRDLRIADDPDFGGGDFLQVDRARVFVKLLPALFGRYEVRRVELEAPRITLIRDAGRFNFESLARPSRSARPEIAAGGSSGPPPESAARLAALPLLAGELQIRDASIRFLDRTTSPPTELAVDDLNLGASGLDTTDAIRMTFDASGAAIDHRSFRKPAGVPLTLSIEAARQSEAIEVERLSGKLGALAVIGKGRVAIAASADDSFEIDVPGAPLAELASFFPSLSGIALSGRIAAHLEAAGKRGVMPDLRGRIELNDVEAAANGGAWKVDGPNATVTLASGSAVLPPTELTLSGIPIRLEAKIESLTQPTIQFEAHADELRPAALAGDGKEGSDEIILRDVTFDGAVHVSARAPGWLASFTSPKGTIRALEYRDLRGVASLQGAVILLRRFQLDSGAGSLVARGECDTGRRPPTLDLHTTVRDIDVGPLLSVAGRETGPNLRGRLRAQLDLHGAGSDPASVVASLSGNGNVLLADGAIEDVNLAESVLGGVTGVSGLSQLVSPKVRQRHPEVFSTGDTRFDSLAATVEIAGRRVTTNDLSLEAPGYAVRGEGSVGFDRRVDLDARFLASENLTADVLASAGEARLLANDQGRLEIPFRLAGKLPDLRLKPDAEFVADTLQRALGEGLERLLRPRKKRDGGGEPPSPAEELLERGLKKLFGE